MANLTSQEKESLDTRLGADLSFPIVNNFTPIAGLDLLLQDIQQLLLTVPGERVNRPEYGCELRNQIWENIQEAADNGAASIEQSLDTFEPRITVDSVNYDINENTSLITFTINFTVNNTDNKVNLVFPFRAGLDLSTP